MLFGVSNCVLMVYMFEVEFDKVFGIMIVGYFYFDCVVFECELVCFCC